MRRCTHAIAAAIATAAVVATMSWATAGTATATDAMTLDPGGTIAASGTLTWSAGTNVICTVALNGQFVPDVNNETGYVVGEITSGSLSRCNAAASGSLVFRGSVPWPLELSGPVNLGVNPTTFPLTLLGSEISLNLPLWPATCDYTGDLTAALQATGSPLRVSSLTVGGGLTLVGGGGLCPARSTVRTGTLSITPVQIAAGIGGRQFLEDPAIAAFGPSSGSRDVTFRNVSGVPRRVRRVALSYGGRGFTIDAANSDCAGNEIAVDARCRVRIDYAQGIGRRRHDFVELQFFNDITNVKVVLGEVMATGR